MAFTLTSISPSTISCEGGGLLTITGTFETGHRYRVHVGETESTADPTCYSGVPGQASAVYTSDQTTIKAYIPLLVSSVVTEVMYSITVIDLDTLETHLLSEVLIAYPKQFHSLTYAYRKVMHEDFKVGPRALALEDEVTVTSGGR